MKAKITKPDGTIIEAEGTPEEIQKLIAGPGVQFVPYPVTPDYPRLGWPWITYTTGTSGYVVGD